MNKEKKYIWLLQIDETANTKFCQQYKDAKKVNEKENIKIINKLAKQGIKKICWIGDEAINYPHIMQLLIKAKSKDIECEFLFKKLPNIKAKNSYSNMILKYLDEVTVCIDSIDDTVNEELGKGKGYFNKIYTFIIFLLMQGIKTNVLTMANLKNLGRMKEIHSIIGNLGIDTWKILSFMPILLDAKLDEKKYVISRDNFKRYFSIFDLIVCSSIKHGREISQYSISRLYNIILPNGDIAIMNEKDSVIVGNILKDDEETIEKKYKNKRKYIIPKKKEEKITVYIANESEKITEDIKEELKKLQYIEIIGTSKKGKEALEQIIAMKPNVLFSQYDFKDISGNEFTDKMVENLKIDCPNIYMFCDDWHRVVIKYKEHYEFYKLGCWLGSNSDYNKRRIAEVMKEYKEYRDTD